MNIGFDRGCNFKSANVYKGRKIESIFFSEKQRLNIKREVHKLNKIFSKSQRSCALSAFLKISNLGMVYGKLKI